MAKLLILCLISKVTLTKIFKWLNYCDEAYKARLIIIQLESVYLEATMQCHHIVAMGLLLDT